MQAGNGGAPQYEAKIGAGGEHAIVSGNGRPQGLGTGQYGNPTAPHGPVAANGGAPKHGPLFMHDANCGGDTV